MATSDPTQHSRLDTISEEIKEVFEKILSEVRSRRDELLEQVIRMKIEFEMKKIPLFENLRELEEMRVHITKLTLKQNLAMKKQTESLADIDSEIEKLRVSMSGESSLKFNCSINQLIEQVILFGEFVDLSSSLIESHSKYSKKLTVDRVINNIYPYYPKILHIDYENDLLYIFSRYSTTNAGDNGAKCVYNAITFICVQNKSYTGYHTICIATNKDYVYYCLYYTSNHSYIPTVYNKDTCLRSFPSQDEINNIFVESENTVLVLCVAKNKVLLRTYNRALYYQREREVVYQWPDSLSEMKSRLRDEKLYILLDKQFLVFNTFGRNTHSIQMGVIPTKWNPISFCVDLVGNIIVTDSATNSIKFFSPEGDLFHTIGEDTVGSDEVAGAKDVVLYKDILIVACGHHIRTY